MVSYQPVEYGTKEGALEHIAKVMQGYHDVINSEKIFFFAIK